MTEINIQALWDSSDRGAWVGALDHYWSFVKPTHEELERQMDTLDPERIRAMNADEWFEFLHKEYFRWKYTAANRYASTTKHLKLQVDECGVQQLHSFKDDIFQFAPTDVTAALKAAMQIRGLGTAGASGLLSLLFPALYGTVDQFVVKALLQVPDLPERHPLERMNPEGLTVSQGVVLIEIMACKAQQLNVQFDSQEWTPRKVDMVLWAVRD
jgi:hypothetical protein